MKRTTSSVITANIYHTSIRKRVHSNEKETLQKAPSQKICLAKTEKGKDFEVCLWKWQCMSQELYFCCCFTVTETYICVDWSPTSTPLWVWICVTLFKAPAVSQWSWYWGRYSTSWCPTPLSELCPGPPHQRQLHSHKGEITPPPPKRSSNHLTCHSIQSYYYAEV